MLMVGDSPVMPSMGGLLSLKATIPSDSRKFRLTFMVQNIKR